MAIIFEIFFLLGAKSKGLFKKKKGISEEVLPLKDIIGVKIKRRRSSGQSEGQGMCLGFIVYSYQVFGPNSLRDRVIEFEHPSEKICKEYCKKIMDYLECKYMVIIKCNIYCKRRIFLCQGKFLCPPTNVDKA